jgi:glutaredoxin
VSELTSERSAQTAPFAVILLTQDQCGFCDHAKQVLTRLAADYPLQVTEIGLADEEGQTLARTAGVLFAPGVLVEGTPFSFGRLSERKLRRALDQRLRDRRMRA